MKKINCPQCAAEHQLRDPSTITFVCEYCDNVVLWDQQGVSLSGKQSRLTEGFSRLYRGATGSIQNIRFEVLGRVRYSFGRGFWDEWYLMFENGEHLWITEDNHEFCRQNQIDNNEYLEAFENYELRQEITLDGTSFVIQEMGEAICLGIEGQLPKNILPNECYPFIDGSCLEGKRTFGLEYDGAQKDTLPSVFVGTWFEAEDLVVDDETLEW